MTRLVWLTNCPYAPKASPSATNTVNWRNSLDILFSLRSSSSWGRPHFITTLPSSAKTLAASNFLLENAPQVKSQPMQYKISKIRGVRAVISLNILREQPSSTLERCRFFHQKLLILRVKNFNFSFVKKSRDLTKRFYLHYDCYDANLITTKQLFNPTPCCRFRPKGHAGSRGAFCCACGSEVLFVESNRWHGPAPRVRICFPPVFE